MLVGSSLPLRNILHHGRYGSRIHRELNSVKCGGGTRVGIRSGKIFCSVDRQADKMRLFVLSDLHTDYAENMTWVKCISTSIHQEDVLLVAGDVAETYDKFLTTMSLLRDRFKHVFYVPGNHDLWCRTESEDFLDSLEKLNLLLHACDELGVESKPKIIGDLGIVPLFSWYHESFDMERDITGPRIPSLEMVCKDFHVCKWPAELSERDDSLARFFDAMNEKHAHSVEEIQQNCKNIITFSHFVPRLDLCPEKRMLFYPNLPKIIGSNFLETRLRSIHGNEGRETACHVFGHTHFSWDARIDGIRYVQAPLAYPRECKRRMNGGEDWLPFCLHSDGKFTDRQHFYWSDYYSVNSREPDNLHPAPWVAKFYKRRLQ
ncbi:hypothetical protein RND81_07G074100 [Saponaria officinalis]|uniref:Calcineurin-like phosphoesterase domain-containing protein n=1 Tax=Saponaria officinalis TaxID=3572 RepID=A0AAW1JMS8_SAPOF